MEKLPDSKHVDVGVLASLFDNTTNSYKYFFLLALLDRIEKSRTGVFPALDGPILLNELIIDMILGAWYPHGFCRLSLGSQDMLQKTVDAIQWGKIRGSWIQAGGAEWNRLRVLCSEQHSDMEKLTKYVPFRLIRPFFSRETKGLPDYRVNDAVISLSDTMFAERKPLYCFSADSKSLILNHDWVEYIDRNIAILRGWILFRLSEYLQAKNPNIAGIVEKLQPPLVRASLIRQQEWWRNIIQLLQDRALCIYSGQRLTVQNFSLDHYLPWSFMAHDRLWNLIPTSKEINSAKSDCIPSERYLEPMVNLQHQGLILMNRSMPENAWSKSVEPWVLDMKIDEKDLLDKERLRSAYKSTLLPLQMVAERQGFDKEWYFSLFTGMNY